MISNPGTVTNVGLGSLQKVLEAFFPDQDAAIQQAMADAQKHVADTQATTYPPLSADVLTISGTKVFVSGGGNTFAHIMIVGS
jgi:PAB1-binding protein PBP1